MFLTGKQLTAVRTLTGLKQQQPNEKKGDTGRVAVQHVTLGVTLRQPSAPDSWVRMSALRGCIIFPSPQKTPANFGILQGGLG